MENRMEERLPQVVEDKLQDAYSMIRSGKIRQTKKRHTYRRWTSVAAACAVIVTASVGVLAAAAYFQKETRQESDRLTYEFRINYELVPGEYKVIPGYLPDGYTDRGDGKYNAEDGSGISVLPIYTMTELDKLDGEIALSGIGEVEHTTLGGMAADIITFRESEKYKKPSYIFLFNEAEGYVLQIFADYDVDREELLKFADHLSVERTGDAVYEMDMEREERKQKETEADQMALDGKRNREALLAAGIPENQLYGTGEELCAYNGAFGYTLTGYEFLDSLEGFDEEKFFDYARFSGWMNPDKTLKPYTRQQYDSDGQLLEEKEAEQRILRVDMKVRCYDNSTFEGAPLGFRLEYVDWRADGSCTWEDGWYAPVPEEKNNLQLDHMAVWLDGAEHTEGKDRQDYFFRSMEKGEELSYTLLFVVDKDREQDFLLSPDGGNSSVDQFETRNAEEIIRELDGYIWLK